MSIKAAGFVHKNKKLTIYFVQQCDEMIGHTTFEYDITLVMQLITLLLNMI